MENAFSGGVWVVGKWVSPYCFVAFSFFLSPSLFFLPFFLFSSFFLFFLPLSLFFSLEPPSFLGGLFVVRFPLCLFCDFFLELSRGRRSMKHWCRFWYRLGSQLGSRFGPIPVQFEYIFGPNLIQFLVQIRTKSWSRYGPNHGPNLIQFLVQVWTKSWSKYGPNHGPNMDQIMANHGTILMSILVQKMSRNY